MRHETVPKPSPESGSSGRSAPKPGLIVWVIYDHPSDWPHHWVLRRQFIFPGGAIESDWVCCLAGSVEELRASLPAGLICWPHQISEDPVIVESWF